MHQWFRVFWFDSMSIQFLFCTKTDDGKWKREKLNHVTKIENGQKPGVCDQMYRAHYQFCLLIFLRTYNDRQFSWHVSRQQDIVCTTLTRRNGKIKYRRLLMNLTKFSDDSFTMQKIWWYKHWFSGHQIKIWKMQWSVYKHSCCHLENAWKNLPYLVTVFYFHRVFISK